VMTILQDEDRSGSAVRRLSPSDLEAVLGEAKAHYDLIVVDTPPVLAIPDAPTLVQTLDGAILVVQWRATPSVAVNASMRTLSAYGARILGGVLTQVRVEALGKTEGSQAYVYRAAAQYFG
jgi:polysaccharide biosynthesis transport protein